MFVIKMKTLIYYFAVVAVTIASIGIIKLYSISDTKPVSTVESDDNSVALLNDEKVSVPILMYHSIMRSANTHSDYIVSEAAFEKDLKFFTENGYTTIFVKDLIDYVRNDKPLPEKPVMLTFDDGYYNNFLYAYPLLKKYNQKAVVSIIGYYTDLYTKTPDQNPSYSHVTWDNVQEMMDSGIIELQNHSYNLHTTDKGRNGSKKKKGESDDEYKAMLMSDLGMLQDAFKSNTGYIPTAFTYPFGSVSHASFPILKEMGFSASFSSESGTNSITKNPECLYMLKRYLRTPKKSAQDILK